MLKPRFCYQILPEAKMAHDELDNDCSCYAQLSLEGGSEIEEDTYNQLHKKLKSDLALQLEIKEEFIEPISQEEYDENQEDK